MRRIIVTVVFLAVAIGAFAQDTTSVPANNDAQQFWLVELSSAPTADGGTAGATQKDKANFRAAAKAANITYVERKSFDTLWNGLAVQATSSAAAAMAGLSGVKAVYPDAQVTYDPGTDEGSRVEMATAIAMTGADLAQNTLGLTGTGVKVAVIDTGLDYKHPDLGNCTGGFGTGCRVAKGYDLVGDAFNADSTSSTYNPVTTPDPDPMDCAGHGTHVAGIIGADGDPAAGHVRGVAPAVTFYAYRVFGCSGSTFSSVMIDAMERALADGAQVVNMSIGAAFQWPQYPTSAASDRLVKRGVVVVAAAGNDGTLGMYAVSSPGNGELVISAASYDNTHVYEQYFTVNGAKYGFLPATAAPAAPGSGSFPLARTGTQTSAADGCSALPAGSLNGMVALIRRGTCSFWQKAFDAQNAGAVGVILYNNAAGFVSPTVAGTPAITIPVVAITQADGNALDTLLASGPQTMTWTSQSDYFINAFTGGFISSFSSFGIAPDLSMKPDIGAPGGNIRSTYPRALGSYAVLSGTSMATPHTAGAVALLLQANPKLQARKVRDILQNNAVPKNYSITVPFVDGTWHQGAGMLNIYNALINTTRITPGKLSLGESAGGPVTRSFTLANTSDHDVTYDLSKQDGLSVANTFAPSLYVGGSTVAFSANPVTVPAGGEASITATITAPSGPNKALYGGWIVATPQGSGLATRLPFSGFVGDYQSIQVLAPTANGFPWLAQRVGTSFSKRLDGAVFTMADVFNMPDVLLHLDHQVQQIQLQVNDAITGRNWQFIDNSKYVGRNSSATGFYYWTFDGTTSTPNGKNTFTVPNGSYTITVRALKALGDPDNPADWETWTSPVFTIARP